jgi:hypothetical protein
VVGSDPDAGPAHQSYLNWVEDMEIDGSKQQVNINSTSESKLFTLPCKTDAIIEFYARHPEGIFSPYEVADFLGEKNIRSIAVICNRLSKPGKGYGHLRKVGRGYYTYSKEPQERQILDDVAEAGRLGFENLTLYRGLVDLGDTPPQVNTASTLESKQSKQVNIEVNTKVNTPKLKEGFPWILQTGQRIEWLLHVNGADEINFIAGGKAPFSVDAMFLLFEKLGLPKPGEEDNGWFINSWEWNIDSKRHYAAVPVTLQEGRATFLKFYNHRESARLEGVSREIVSYSDILLALLEVNNRGMGRAAIKRTITMQKEIDTFTELVKADHNLIISLSDRYHRDHPHKRKGKQVTLK